MRRETKTRVQTCRWLKSSQDLLYSRKFSDQTTTSSSQLCPSSVYQDRCDSLLCIRSIIITSVNMLYLVGLGLADERDITVKGLEIVKRADRVYLEAYTSILLVDKETLVRSMSLWTDR